MKKTCAHAINIQYGGLRGGYLKRWHFGIILVFKMEDEDLEEMRALRGRCVVVRILDLWFLFFQKRSQSSHKKSARCATPQPYCVFVALFTAASSKYSQVQSHIRSFGAHSNQKADTVTRTSGEPTKNMPTTSCGYPAEERGKLNVFNFSY